MILWDVNLLLYAATSKSPHHGRCRGLLQKVVDGGERFAIYEQILAAVVRIATNPKVFDPPASTRSVFDFCNALRGHPQAVTIAPGVRHWDIFQDLVLRSRIQAGDITDAYFAALAIEHGCEWWTADVGFSRFDGLRWHNPIE